MLEYKRIDIIFQISQPNKKSTIVEESFFFANNSKREPKTASQIFEQVVAPNQGPQRKSREPEVSPFCVRRQETGREPSVRSNNQSATYKSNGYAEQTSFTTFDAIQNVQVREPSSNHSNKSSLDNLISSNRASNNDKKDHLYWERVSSFYFMAHNLWTITLWTMNHQKA